MEQDEYIVDIFFPKDNDLKPVWSGSEQCSGFQDPRMENWTRMRVTTMFSLKMMSTCWPRPGTWCTRQTKDRKLTKEEILDN